MLVLLSENRVHTNSAKISVGRTQITRDSSPLYVGDDTWVSWCMTRQIARRKANSDGGSSTEYKTENSWNGGRLDHDNRSSRKSCISCFSFFFGLGSSVGSGGASVRPRCDQWRSRVADDSHVLPLFLVREGRAIDPFVDCFAAFVRNLDFKSRDHQGQSQGFTYPIINRFFSHLCSRPLLPSRDSNSPTLHPILFSGRGLSLVCVLIEDRRT